MDEITKSMQADIDAARETSARLNMPQVSMKNGPLPYDRPVERIGPQIDALIAALQMRIDTLKRVKESL